MENNYLKNTQVTMLSPFEEYLKNTDFSFDLFANCLREQNTQEIEHLLKPLFQYGMVSILIPLNEFQKSLLPDNQMNWWNELIEGIDTNKLLYEYDVLFHEEAKKASIMGDDLPYPWSFYASFAEMQRIIWSIYENSAETIIENFNFYIGLIIPGLYCTHLEKEYLSFIDNKILPILIYKLDNVFSYTSASTKYEKSILIIIVRTLSQELGWRYYNRLSLKVNSILDYNEEAFCKLQSSMYKELLLPCGECLAIDGYISIQWANNIERLCEYVTLLSLGGFSNRILKHVVPILYQCVGFNEKANENLIDLLQSLDCSIHSSFLLLIALYRAVAVTRYDEKSFLYQNMVTLWGTNRIPTELLTVINNIVAFCRHITVEIPQRFKSNTLANLIAVSDPSDRFFYSLYYYKNIHLDNLDDDIGNLFRLSPFIFENNAIVEFMEKKEKRNSG